VYDVYLLFEFYAKLEPAERERVESNSPGKIGKHVWPHLKEITAQTALLGH